MLKKKNQKIAIGTAQFSNNYGITNNQIINQKNISNILKDGLSLQITTIDTAPEYYNVEKKLGKFNLENFDLITKTALNENDKIIDYKELESNIKKSFSNLNTKFLYALLIRSPVTLLKDKNLLDTILSFKNKNLISKIGYTLYDVEELERLYEYFKPDIVQIPYSIVDQRFEKKNWISKMHNDGVEIHVRSVFLQGLLLSDPNEIPHKFNKYKNFFKKLDFWIKENKVSKLQACLNSILNDKRISKIVIGINNRNSLHEINRIKKTSLYYPKWIKLNDKRIIDPREW